MTYERACVLCAARGRQTRLEVGHVCIGCQSALLGALRAIPALAEQAATMIEPKPGSGSSAPSWESKPPINCDAVEPYLALMELNVGDPSSRVTILDCLEMWERAIREDRELIPYGPASAHRTAQGQSTLVGVVGFLVAQMEWIAATPTFGLEEFADHIHRAHRIMRRWDSDRDDVGTMVRCPTITEQGECGYRLYYREADEHVTCRRCGASRDVTTLVAVVMESGGQSVWVDPEAIQHAYAIPESLLGRWARRGWVKTSHGRYLLSSVMEARERQRADGYSKILARVKGA